jgi:hypothetical protein
MKIIKELQQTEVAGIREETLLVEWFVAGLGGTMATTAAYPAGPGSMQLSGTAVSVFGWPGTNPWSLLPFSGELGAWVAARFEIGGRGIFRNSLSFCWGQVFGSGFFHPLVASLQTTTQQHPPISQRHLHPKPNRRRIQIQPQGTKILLRIRIHNLPVAIYIAETAQP